MSKFYKLVLLIDKIKGFAINTAHPVSLAVKE